MQLAEAKQSNLTVVAVMVLYRCALAGSASFSSLMNVRESGICDLKIALFDNSPEHPAEEDLAFIRENSGWISYTHFPENASLAKIYNLGIRLGREGDFMLLLDQDSAFDTGFFSALLQAQATHPEIDLFLPLVKYERQIVSPGKWNGYKGRYIKSISAGPVLSKGMTAVASGMFIRYRYLLADFPGFDERFQLYGIDTNFMQHYASERRFFFLLPYQLDHELALYAEEAAERKIFRFQEFAKGSLLLTGKNGLLKWKCFVFLLYKALRYSIAYRNPGFFSGLKFFFQSSTVKRSNFGAAFPTNN